MSKREFRLTLNGQDVTDRMCFIFEHYKLTAEPAPGYAFTICLCGAPVEVASTSHQRWCACGRGWKWKGVGWQTDAREWPEKLAK